MPAAASLAVEGAQAAIDFYVQALGATLDFKLIDPSDGRIGHAELLFGATRAFIADEYPDFGAVGPETLGGSPVKFHLNVADAYLRLGDPVSARHHMAAGRALIDVLPVDGYGATIRRGLDRLDAALAE